VPPAAAAGRLAWAMTCRTNRAACRKVQCAALRGKDRRECLDRCERSIECPTGAAPRPTGGARRGTLAYVVTECRTLNGQLSGGQKLVVRHGDCDPRTIMEFTYPEPVSDPFGVCEPFGSSRAGYVALAAGPFQRIGVSPDGSLVVFEVTNGFSSLRQAGVEPTPLPPDSEGTYTVRADGTDLHRLGPPSRQSSSPRLTTLVQRIFYSRCFPLAAEDMAFAFDPFFRFSPDGRLIVFTDLDSRDAVQLAILDTKTTNRTEPQLITELPGTASQTAPFCDLFFCAA